MLLLALQPSFARMIHQEGRLIHDGQGQPIKLRGVLLEGWLMWNGNLWGSGILSSESMIDNKLTELVGVENMQWFRQQIYQSFITEDDIRMIAAMGLNMVRVPFNHTILEDDDAPFQYKDSGWALLDQLLHWCETHEVYVVLDLHSAPGGQSTVFVNDPDGSPFYTSDINRRRTALLWRAIAERYRDRTIIAGYDLLNEPQLPLFTPGSALVDVYRQIVREIREVDQEHMVILSGAGVASDDLSLFKDTLDDNQALAFHSYNLFGSDIHEKTHRQFIERSRALNVPIWNGEMGANTLEWVSALITLFEQPENRISGWTFWPWKRVPQPGKSYRHLMAIQSPPQWDLVRNWVAEVWFAPRPSRQQALDGMRAFLKAIQAENLVRDEEMARVLTRHTRGTD